VTTIPSGRTRVVAVLALAAFIGSVDLTVATTMLRRIIVHLEIPLPDGFGRAAWIVNAYIVAYVGAMPLAGRLSDVVGRRRVVVGSLALFSIGSALAPFATTLETFVAARVVAAIGAGAVVPAALATVADLFPERRGRAFGVLFGAETLGYVCGPLVGAVLIRFADWPWHFYGAVPTGIVALILAARVMRHLPRPTLRRSLDLPGALLITTALVAVVIGLLSLGSIASAGDLAGFEDSRSGPAWPVFALAVVAGIGFVIAERRAGDPLVPPGLLGRRPVVPALIVNLSIGAILAVAMVNVPLFVNLVLEADLRAAAVTSGIVLTALTATMAMASPVGGWLADRITYRIPVMFGTALLVTGLLLMGRGWDTDVTTAAMAAHLVIAGAGFGLATAPLSAAVVDAAEGPDRGVAASVVLVARLVGLALGLAGLTAWALNRFDALRRTISLPPITDPAYADAVEAAQRQISATVLSETFLVSAVIAAAALVVAMAIRRSPPRAT
jgi:MFS family permease